MEEEVDMVMLTNKVNKIEPQNHSLKEKMVRYGRFN